MNEEFCLTPKVNERITQAQPEGSRESFGGQSPPITNFSIHFAADANAWVFSNRAATRRHRDRVSGAMSLLKVSAICLPFPRLGLSQSPTPSSFARTPLSSWSKQMGQINCG